MTRREFFVTLAICILGPWYVKRRERAKFFRVSAKVLGESFKGLFHPTQDLAAPYRTGYMAADGYHWYMDVVLVPEIVLDKAA